MFGRGVALASQGRVRLDIVTDSLVTAQVVHDTVYLVALRLVGEHVEPECTCTTDSPTLICEHAVAAAHATWQLKQQAGER